FSLSEPFGPFRKFPRKWLRCLKERFGYHTLCLCSTYCRVLLVSHRKLHVCHSSSTGLIRISNYGISQPLHVDLGKFFLKLKTNFIFNLKRNLQLIFTLT